MKKFLQGLSRKQFNKSHSSNEDLLYEADTFLKHILGSIQDAIFIIDEHYKFVYVNEAACRHYNLSQKQMLRMYIKDIDVSLSQKEISQKWELLKQKKILSFNTVHKASDGNFYPVKVTSYYLEYNKKGYNFSLVQDEAYITNLLNTQKDFIILTDGNDIISANIQLFQFLNYKNIDEFKKEHHCVCEFFIEENGYMSNHVDWMKDVKYNPNNDFKVKIKNEITNKIHSFALSSSPFDQERSLITFQDVTELEDYKNQLELLAITDEMTSLYNRRYFNKVFSQEINRTQRSSQKLGFIMFDIDFFKQYNDTYGHLEGDNILIKIAHTCKDQFHRASDFCFRLGGEEFGVLLIVKSDEELHKQAQALRLNVENLHIEHKNNAISAYVTISLGAVLSDGSESFEALYGRVDHKMYQAKEAGRNQVVF